MRTAFQHGQSIRNQSPSASQPAAATSKLPKGLEGQGYETSSQMRFMKSSSSKTKLAAGETAVMTVTLPKTGTSNIPNEADGKMYDVTYTYDSKNAKAKVAKGSNLEVVSSKINDDGTATVVVRATKNGASIGPTQSSLGQVDSPVYLEQTGTATRAVEVKETKPSAKPKAFQDEALF